ncbi:MAG: hypothetical protein Kow0090_19300 [Myxococcota bacterium]
MNRSVRYNSYALFMAVISILYSFLQSASADDGAILRWGDVKALIERHPVIGKSQSKVKESEGKLSLVSQYPNPEVSLSFSKDRELEGSRSAYTWGGEISVPIEWLVKRKYRKDAASADLTATKYERDALRLEVVYELRKLFLKVAYTQRLLELLNQSAEGAEKLLGISRLRVEYGEAKPIETLRLEIEYEKIKLATARTSVLLDAYRRELNIWLRRESGKFYAVMFEIEALHTLPDLDSILERAKAEHPVLTAASFRIAREDALLGGERHKLFPDMSVGGFYERELDSDSYGGKVTLTIPLWNWNRGGVSRAEARMQTAIYEAKEAEARLTKEITEKYLKARLLADSAAKYRDILVPKAKDTLELVEKAYNIGEQNLADLIDVQRTYIEMEVKYLSILSEYHLTYAALKTLAGEEL